MTNNNLKYKVVSLFSGAMGLDLGLDKSGRFEILATVEKEQIYCDTIRANVELGNLSDSPRVYGIDIQDLDPKELFEDLGIKPGDIDLLVGGPPCQSFSTAGRRATVQDPRGTLLWDFLRFVEILQPKVFLMENVRGLLSAAVNHRPIAERPEKGGRPLSADEEPGSVLHLFASELRRLGNTSYRMDCFEVNAVNYGAPQLRERAIFIGNRFNEIIDFPKPTHGPGTRDNGQLEFFGKTRDRLSPWKTLGDAIRGLVDEEPVIMDFSPRKKKYLSLVPPGGNWRHLPENLQKESLGRAFHAKGGRSGWWRRLSFDLPCPTLVTMPNHASTALCHPEEVRALTVREYCRIQEFPDNWVVCGTPCQQYAQIGNAVPVRLGQIAGEVIALALDRMAPSGWKPSGDELRPFRKVYLQSHVRTRQWFKNGMAVQWNDGEENADAFYAPPKTKYAWSLLGEGNRDGS
ncbi:MAG: DNA cytosine methyltransferase [Syntrophobacteraceae bacterium]|nr:DNA cytosine methyltransferase [Syntrophobacteraceae bacterium]